VLTNAPKSITCAAPAIARSSIKRALPSMTILNDWKFSTFYDMATYTDAALEAVPNGPEIVSAPSLVQALGAPDVFVVDDDKEVRHVVDTASFNAWRFTTDLVKPIAPVALAAAKAGLDWPVAPLLVKSGDSATVYVLDESVPAPAGDAGVLTPPTAIPTDADAGDAVGTGIIPDPDPTSDADSGSSSGCSISRASSPAKNAGWLILSFATLLLARRRSRKRADLKS